MNDQTLRYTMRKKFSRYQPSIKDLGTLVYMGTPDGLVTVPNRPGFVYVMSNDAAPTEVFNKRVPPGLGLPVVVGYDPSEPWLYQVLSVHTQGSTSESGTSPLLTQVPAHADNHAVLGTDPVWVDKRQILDARVGPTVGLSIEVRPTVLRFGPTLVPVAFQEIDLTAHVPASGSSLYALVAVNSSGSVIITDGAASAGQTPATSTAPAIPAGQVGLAYVRLYGGQVEIYEGPEYTDILDIRTLAPYDENGNAGDIQVVDPNNETTLFPGTAAGLYAATAAAVTGSWIYIPLGIYDFNTASGSPISITDKDLTFRAKEYRADFSATVTFRTLDMPTFFNFNSAAGNTLVFIGCTFDVQDTSNASGSSVCAIASTTGKISVLFEWGQIGISSNYAGSKAYIINSSGSGAVSLGSRFHAISVLEEAGANAELVNAPIGATVTINMRTAFLNRGKSSRTITLRNSFVAPACTELIASGNLTTVTSFSDRSDYFNKIYHSQDLHAALPTYHVPEPSAVNKGIRSSGSPAYWVEIPDPSVLSQDPTGFASPSDVVVNYDSAARTITLTGNIAAYWSGSPVPGLVSGSFVSGSHPATNGKHFYYFDGTNFTWSTTEWAFYQLQIASVYYSAADKIGFRETHGFMPWQAHEEFHDVIGTYKESGGTLGGYVLASTTAANRRPTVAATVVHDEDDKSTIPALASGSYTTMSLSGSGVNAFTPAYAEIIPVSGNQPYYNAFASGSWAQTLMTANTYTSVWLVGIPVTADAGSQAYRYIWIQGQSASNLVAGQQALTTGSLNLGQFQTEATEFVFLAQVIINYQSAGGGNWVIDSIVNITGTRNNQVASPAGAYLSVVTTDASMSGLGTVASPLAVVWGSGSSALSNVFVKKAGDTMTGLLTVTTSTFPPIRSERTNTTNNAFSSAMQILNTTTADMIDGFGSQIAFAIRDDAGVINNIGGIGIVRDGADTQGAIVFSTGTGFSEKVRISYAGNVGIGTTVPGNNLILDILGGNVHAKYSAGVDYAFYTGANVEVLGNAYWDGAYKRLIDGKSAKFSVTSAGEFTVTLASGSGVAGSAIAYTTTALKILNTGNVGIGTTAPATGALLAVGGNTVAAGTLSVLGVGAYGAAEIQNSATSTSNILNLRNSAGTAVVVFKESGNVGIGTTAPLSFVCIGEGASTFDGYSIRDGGVITSEFFYSTVTGENRIGGVASYAFPTFYSGGNEAMRILTTGLVGINTTAPNSTLHVAGSLALPITSTPKTTTYTVLASDFTVLCNSTGGSFTVNLPTAVGITGRIYVIKTMNDTSTKTVTIDPSGSETIDGSSTKVLQSVGFVQYMIQSDGANWQVISYN